MNANSPNKVDFYGRDFYIDKNVLIPRPETEQLIDAVLNLAGKPYLPGVRPGKRQLPKNPVIYDIGTGSGCIAVTLALELPEAKIVATDVSEPALQVAQKNAKNLSVTTITFIIAHLLDFVKSDFADRARPDVIVANLPYVDKNWPWVDQNSLTDPDIALYADDGGLALIKELIASAANLKTPYLVLEADPCQHEEIINFSKESNYRLLETRGFILTFVTL